jgi:hypothetical protein
MVALPIKKLTKEGTNFSSGAMLNVATWSVYQFYPIQELTG